MSKLVELFEHAYEVRLPTHKVVCPWCRGEGHHVNPAVDSDGISGEAMDEPGEDFRADYIAGVYDVPRHECGGIRVIDEVDEDRCDPAVLRDRREWIAQEMDYRTMIAAERRAGA